MQNYQYFVAHEFSKQYIIDFRGAIEEAFEGTGLTPYYADLEVRPVGKEKYILERIKEKILTTQFGIYDITNITKPNVFIELAFAMATDKPLYIICKLNEDTGKTEIPADLQGLGRIEYTAFGELTELIKKLIVKPEVERLNKIKMRAKVREEYTKLPEEDVLKKCAKIYQAEDLVQRSGNKVKDKDAYNQMAWHVNLSEKTNYIIFGPYEELSESGTYLALFKIKIDVNSPTNLRFGVILEILDRSGEKKLSERLIRKSDFTQPYTYQFFELEFEYHGGILEYRFFNPRQKGTLWIDYIAVIKLS